MRTSLNTAGMNANQLSFAERVDLAARHGFNGLDTSAGAVQKMAGEHNGSLQAVRDLLTAKNVSLATFGLEVEWRKDEDTFRDDMSRLLAKAAAAQALGVTRCTTWMSPAVSGELAAWEAQTVRRFREIARVLGDHAVRFGLEWVGPHHLRAGGDPNKHDWIHTLDGTLALIRQIGEPNVGLLVDCYHCHTTGVGETELAKLGDDQIVHVHVNDAKKGVPIGDLKDGDRILPGEGQIDLAGFLRGLRGAGYTGFVACEVLSPQPLAGDPDTAAALVRQSLTKIGV